MYTAMQVHNYLPQGPVLLHLVAGIIIMTIMHHYTSPGWTAVASHLADQLLRLSRSFCNLSTPSLSTILVQI